MKKYLITGALAFIACGFMTSCHETEIDYASQIEAKKTTFAENFVKFYGEIDPNQDWGFGTKTQGITRSENANANEWADPNKAYGGLLVPPRLTPEQIAVVKEYFQTVKNPRYEDPQWTNYFMQQVYKGHEDPKTGTDPKTGKPYSPEAYLAANGSTYLEASDYMDHLAAIDGDFVDHINNFNHGDCSENRTVLDNGGNANDGPFHSDKIMYMKESTTKSFGYYNSNGSVRRTEYTGLVSFQTIINVLGSKANCLNDGWNRSFMGFDFEQMVGPEIYAKELDYSAGWSADIPGGFPIKDYIWYEHNGKKYHMLVAEQNMYCGTPLEITDAQVQQEGYIDGLLADGYLPVVGGANKKWVKVGGCADGYYSDWIVCLTQAKGEGGTITVEHTTTGYWLRKYVKDHRWVFCEDLGQASNRKDFDYNDLVFDAKIIQDYTSNTNDVNTMSEYGTPYAVITPLAAGGELTISVADKNVHEMFGLSDAVLINTIDPNTDSDVRSSGVPYAPTNPGRIDCTTTATYPTANILDIPINVQIYNNAFEILSRKGQAPHKIAVTPGIRWAQERVDINEAQPGFADWVKDVTVGANFWSSEASANRYPYMPDDDFLISDQTGQWLPVEYINGGTISTYTVNLSSSETSLWNGEEYLSSWSTHVEISNRELVNKGVAEGSIIRIYGVSNSSWALKVYNINSSGSWDVIVDKSGDSPLLGYIDFKLDANTAGLLRNNFEIAIEGDGLTVLCVSIDNTKITSN